jgi:hypothetical protein
MTGTDHREVRLRLLWSVDDGTKKGGIDAPQPGQRLGV